MGFDFCEAKTPYDAAELRLDFSLIEMDHHFAISVSPPGGNGSIIVTGRIG